MLLGFLGLTAPYCIAQKVGRPPIGQLGLGSYQGHGPGRLASHKEHLFRPDRSGHRMTFPDVRADSVTGQITVGGEELGQDI